MNTQIATASEDQLLTWSDELMTMVGAFKERGKVNEAEILYREIEQISDQIVNLIDQVQIQVTH